MALIDRKQREFERREEDILDAALALFSRPNWESVTIEQIARAADIGKGTLYKHFASKDELLFRLMMQFFQGLLEKLRHEVLDEGDILQRFRHTFEFVFRYHLEFREYRYVVEYCNRIDFKERADASWHASFRQLDQAFSAWGDPMFIAAMEQGLIQKRPLQELQIGLHVCFDGAVHLLWSGNDWCIHGNAEEIIKSVTDFMMAGLIGQVEAAQTGG